MTEIEQYLKQCFFVDGGKLFWRDDRPREHFSSKSVYRQWLTKFAGQEVKCLRGGDFKVGFTVNKERRVFDYWWLYGVITGDYTENDKINAELEAEKKKRKQYVRESLEIKDGVIVWRNDRPVSHFASAKSAHTSNREMGGNPALTTQGSTGIYRVRMKINGIHYAITEEEIYNALGVKKELHKQTKKTGVDFADVFKIMNKSIKRAAA